MSELQQAPPIENELRAVLPMIQIFDTSPVPYNPAGINVPIPVGTTVNLTIRAHYAPAGSSVRGKLTDLAGGVTQHNGMPDGPDWRYVVPLNTPNKQYIFHAYLVDPAETELTADDLNITTPP